MTAIDNISDDFIISVLDIDQLIRKIRWLEAFDDARFLNNIYASFFYKYRTLLSYHSVVADNSCGNETSSKIVTRRDQCLDIIEKDLTFVLPSIVSRLTDFNTRELVQNTLGRVANKLKNRIQKNTRLSFYNRRELVRQIDSFVEKHHFGILVPNVSPDDKLSDFLQNINGDSLLIEITDNSTSNVLKSRNDAHRPLIDSLTFMSYPYVHSDLPRYWNDAHLVPLILWRLKQVVADFLSDGRTPTWENDNSINEAFEDYEVWDNEQNEVDEALPGLQHLSNKQMFWLAMTHQRCLKSDDLRVKDYAGSDKEMLRTFGCKFEPKFLNRFGVLSPPDFARVSFMNEKYFQELHLKIWVLACYIIEIVCQKEEIKIVKFYKVNLSHLKIWKSFLSLDMT